jgi:hypothetical protein
LAPQYRHCSSLRRGRLDADPIIATRPPAPATTPPRIRGRVSSCDLVLSSRLFSGATACRQGAG